MKKTTIFSACLGLGLTLTSSGSLFAQSWSLTGNAGTNSSSNFVGTTDNNALIFRTNNQRRIAITTGNYGGLEAGTSTQPGYISISSKDISDSLLPFIITGNIQSQTWGNAPGRTMGRLIRLNQGPSVANGGVNWYDMGIGQDTCFFITNHSIPPSFGNGTIRKRMIVISPQDRVGINLPGNDAIGTGAVPTANFHTNGTVRLQNLPSGTGNVLVIDNAGNVYRGASTAKTNTTDSNLEPEVEKLKSELAELKSMITGLKQGYVRIVTADEKLLIQNSPNPFTSTTTIKYMLPSTFQSAFMTIKNVNGKAVKTYTLSAQNGNVVLDGGELAAGVYFYSLVVDGKTVETKKMVLSK
jgi:hypothetical protein